MGMYPLGTYPWVLDNDSMHAGAGCLAMVRGTDPETALELVAPGEPTVPADGIYDRFDWPEEVVAPVVALQMSGWTLLVQAMGHVLTDTTTVEHLSRRGEVVSLTSNVNLKSAFVVARDGTIRRQFDPYQPDFGGLGFGGSAVGAPLPDETDPRLTAPDEKVGLVRAYQLIELLTGIRLGKTDVNETAGRVYRLAPLIASPR